MAPENLIGKADALTADENARSRDEPHAALTMQFAAERTLGPVPFDLAARSLQRRDLHAGIVVEMDVQRRQRQIMMTVEILHQPFR